MTRFRPLTSIAFLMLLACSRPAIRLNAPPALDGAEVFLDGRNVGELKASHHYRWSGLRDFRSEIKAPPRHEANLELESLALGRHSLRLVKPGFAEYRGTFTYSGGHLELFITDEAEPLERPGRARAN